MRFLEYGIQAFVNADDEEIHPFFDVYDVQLSEHNFKICNICFVFLF